VELIDMTGRVLLNEYLYVMPGFNSNSIPTGEISLGMYIVRISTETRILSKKVFRN
jgi:hypothetical protein